MNRIRDRKTLFVYTVLSIMFIMVLGVLFVQVAKHYVIQAYEEQLNYDSQFVSQDIDLNQTDLQSQLDYYSEALPVDLILYDEANREYLHTFTSTESKFLNEVLGEELSNNTKVIDSHLLQSVRLNDNTVITLVSEQLPIYYLNTTLWSVIIVLALLVGIFIWSLGNRLYENYVTPIREASKTASELSEGNYKARIHDAPYGIVSELGQSINKLARNLEYITAKYENQNDRLKTVVNNVESGLLLINEKGLTRLANQAFVNYFSNQDDIVGEVYYDVIENQALNEALQEVIFMERKKQVTIETDRGHYFEVYLAPIWNDQETWKGVVVVCHDITKIKQLENVRKDFVANVSHELRTPITSIQGFVETLLDGNQHDEEIINKFLKIIDKETRRLNTLIKDLLDLSSIEKDDFTLTKSYFSIQDLMSEVNLVMERQLEEHQLESNLDVPEDLEIYADYNRLYQVVLNLYSNAIQYTQLGGKIEWNVVQEDGFVHFNIQDTGIGIPEQAQDRIFERFYRVDRDRSRQTGGTGLGLSIVKHIVEAHGGTIDLQSKEGEGTSITVSIPQLL
ncbi:two-component system histidine kinase PnpS [Aquisalibacillus elongatus]|uniref:histidine kinase n=1 Tax=Aquisalibacillus elongatus TaxID=485577 RepID=A0A3N5BD73_9BACI|nr:ATP-binding protein [Aquisalibacillus elongatus]RPF55387.1 PAS/PAC sensor signal transduction histidine kinase [Aquisalibacillus elongatus]